eukprot:m.19602 g.19602  ORF g.19602 m.19602 type:complete len:549 (+) comp5138_c0_seq1:109-1755(+)
MICLTFVSTKGGMSNSVVPTLFSLVLVNVMLLLMASTDEAAAFRSCTPASVEQWLLFLAQSNCESFSLAGVDLGELDDKTSQDLYTALTASTHMTSLHLVRTNLKVEGAQLLRNVLLDANLEVVDVSHVKFDKASLKIVLEGLVGQTKLVRLDMINCGLDDDDAFLLAEALQQGIEGARAGRYPLLYLNLLGNHISSRGANALAAVLSKMKNVVSLDMSMNPMGDNGVAALATIVDAGYALSFLSLSSVEATTMGARMIGASLGKGSLKKFSFSKNHNLGLEGGKYLGKGLAHALALEFLDLSMCGLGSDGVQKVLSGLMVSASAHLASSSSPFPSPSPALKHLLLSFNNIEGHCDILNPFLETHPAIEIVDLSNNPLDTVWCESLIGRLSNSYSFCYKSKLKRINLRKTRISLGCIEQLDKVMERGYCHGMVEENDSTNLDVVMGGGYCDVDGNCDWEEDDLHDHKHTDPSSMYLESNFDTDLLALIAGFNLEMCLTQLGKHKMLEANALKESCCGRADTCANDFNLPLNTKEESQRWERALKSLCK